MSIIVFPADAVNKYGRWNQHVGTPITTSIPPPFATLTVVNTSASAATPSETYTTFGMAFKKGDVPSGSTPLVRRLDTEAQLTAQFDLRSTWADGSLRWCEVSTVLPSIPAGGSFQITCEATVGSYNNTAVRVLSDITSNTDIEMVLTNLVDSTFTTYATGTSTVGFNDASAHGGIHLTKLKSGPVCDQWLAWNFFGQQGGGTSDQLAAFFYVTAWTKQSDNSIACFSHITRVHNGWLNQLKPQKYIYSAQYQNNGSTIRDYGSTAASDKTFTLAGSNNITCTNHGRMPVDAVLVTNSGGALPTGLAANTIYYVTNVVDANTMAFATTGPFAFSGTTANRLTISGGTGTQTLQYRICHHHHSSWFSCGTDGLPDWTANQPTIYVQPDQNYLHSTGILPPYDLTMTKAPSNTTYPVVASGGTYSTSAFTFPYTPMSTGRWRVSLDDTGGADMIGWMPNWVIRAYLDPTDYGNAKNARVHALMQAGSTFNWLNEASGRVPVFCGNSGDSFGATGDYPGMGSTAQTRDWANGSTTLTGVINPPNDGGAWNNSQGGDWSHQGDSVQYSKVIGGGAHLIDLHIMMANSHPFGYNPNQVTGVDLFQRRIRTKTSENYHYGCCILGGQIRQIGWGWRTINYCCSTLPDSYTEKPYFDQLRKVNMDMAAEWINDLDPDSQTCGPWWGSSGSNEYSINYMMDYLRGSVAHNYFLFGDPNTLIWANHLQKLAQYIANGNLCNYAAGCRIHWGNASPTSWSNISQAGIVYGDASGDGFSWTATAGTPGVVNVGYSWNPGCWSIQNGDKVLFSPTASDGANTPLPGGIVAYQYYYVVGASPSQAATGKGTQTHCISLTNDGPSTANAIAFTTSSPRLSPAYQPITCPTATVDMDHAKSGDTYFNSAVASFGFNAACGIPGADACYNIQKPKRATLPGNGVSIWAWGIVDSF